MSLFERRRSRARSLTDTGKVLYERAAELLSDASVLDQEMLPGLQSASARPCCDAEARTQ